MPEFLSTIEFAKLTATPVFTPVFDYKSHDALIQHGDEILSAYDALAEELISQDRSNVMRHLERRDCFHDKQCSYCGGVIIYIGTHNFWSCENYYKVGKPDQHMKYSGLNPVLKKEPVSLPRNPLFYVLQKTGLSGKIKHKALYEFIMATGRKDLRIKYGLSGMGNTFNGYEKGTANSKEQEARALKMLSKIYTKVLYQQCITYKITGQKEKFCIPDFICSTKDIVTVVDAKLCFIDIDKMDMYTDLVRHILKSKGDKRQVTGGFAVNVGEVVYDENRKYRIFNV